MMKTGEADLGITGRVRDPSVAIDSPSVSPAVKRTDTKHTPAVIQPAASDTILPLDVGAAAEQPISHEQVRHSQVAAVKRYELAHAAAIATGGDDSTEEELLNFDEDHSDDPIDEWSPNWVAPTTFDGADAEANPDLVDIPSAESEISSCIFEVVASAVPDSGLSKPQPGAKG